MPNVFYLPDMSEMFCNIGMIIPSPYQVCVKAVLKEYKTPCRITTSFFQNIKGVLER